MRAPASIGWSVKALFDVIRASADLADCRDRALVLERIDAKVPLRMRRLPREAACCSDEGFAEERSASEGRPDDGLDMSVEPICTPKPGVAVLRLEAAARSSCWGGESMRRWYPRSEGLIRSCIATQ